MQSRIPTVVIMMALQREKDALSLAKDVLTSVLDAGLGTTVPHSLLKIRENAKARRIETLEPCKPQRSTNTYEEFLITSNRRPLVRVVTVTLAEMGPLSAAAVTAETLQDWHPDVFFLAGICAGVPDDKTVRLGDIIVADKVVDRDSGKLVCGEMHHTFPTITCDESFFIGMRNFGQKYFRHHTVTELTELYHRQSNDNIPGDEDAHSVRGNKRARYPADVIAKWVYEDSVECHQIVDPPGGGTAPDFHDIISVHTGTMLSGATVIKSVSHRKDLLKQRSDTKGIEMEGAGIAAVFRRFSDRPRLAVVKGVCDFADEMKNDRWQGFSAATSALFVFEYLLQLSDEEISFLPRMPQASLILEHRVPWHFIREGRLNGWTRQLVYQLASIASDEFESIIKDRYSVKLSQAYQYMHRARTLFGSVDADHEQILVTAVERISRFWFGDDLSTEIVSFIDIQPSSTTRLFVLDSTIKSDSRKQRVKDQLDAHRRRYKNVFICDEETYLKSMKTIVLGGSDTNIWKQDFAVRLLFDKPIAFWWLERELLSARDLTSLKVGDSKDLPVNLELYIKWMSGLPYENTYRWEDVDAAINMEHLTSILDR